MWKAYSRILLAGLSLSCNGLPALANFNFTQGGSSSMFSFDSGTTPAGTSNCAAASTECAASVPINTAGSPLFITSTPGIVAGAGTLGTPGGGVVTVQGGSGGTNLPVSQATAASLNATVVGTGTFAVQAAQSGTWTVQPGNTANTTAWLVTGTGGTFPSTQSGTWNIGTVTAVTAITNALPAGTNLMGKVGIDQTTPGTTNGVQVNAALPAGTNLLGKVGLDQTTPGTTNAVALSTLGANAVSTGNGTAGTGVLRVAIASDNTANSNPWLVNPGTISTWGLATVGAGTAPTNQQVAGCVNASPTPTANQSVALSCDGSGSLKVAIISGGGSGGTSSNFGSAFPSAGTAIGLTNGTNMVAWSATTNYGTAPAAIAVPAVNAYITNTNANGSATSANSSPVVIASDQAAVAIKAASASIASGAIASGAVASGAFASGSIGSGAIASGAVAAGAVAAGAYVSGSILSGALASGAVVDITNMSASTGSAPPSKAIYLGANSAGATGGQIAGLISCNSHVFKHITTATDTLAVQGVASQTIYICGWRARAAGVATWYLENTASTNANCSSANTQLTGVATEAANTGEVFAPPFWTGLKNTTANGLCINSTGTGGVDVDIWYAQF